MHFLGLAGMPRRYYTYGEGSGWAFWNAIVSFSAFFLAASVLLFVYNIGKSIRSGQPAGNNPWDGATLEWAIPSPPPEFNFAQVPTIAHRDPLWWENYGRHEGGVGHDAPSGEVLPQDLSHINEVHGHVHMPNPSFYPMITALGMFIGACGFVFDNPKITIGLLHLPTLGALGLIVMILGLYGWAFEPAG
jgi:cytochrome c oxidase subunit 1